MTSTSHSALASSRRPFRSRPFAANRIRPIFGPALLRSVVVVVAALTSAGCATVSAPSRSVADWLPDATDWTVRDVDDSVPPKWVLYERDASVAEVKEFRVVGVVDAAPEVVARSVRQRLLDDKYLPDGLHREILSESENEVVQYGFQPLPFPFDDRDVTERIRFTNDPDTGDFLVESTAIDSDTPVPEGALRIPVARNLFRIRARGAGQSVVTIDSVHDLGGSFPNAMIDAPVCDQLVLDLSILGAISRTLMPPVAPK